MTWVPADDTALAGAITKGNNIRTSDFFVSPIFDSCVENPPCPWDKSGNDNLKESELMPIIAPNDGVSTYRFRIYEREDNGTTSYERKGIIADYIEDQSKLPANKRSDFTFFDYSGKIEFIGTAVIDIEKIQAGSVQSTYTYLFNLIDPPR